MLQAHQVSKSYGVQTILDKVTFSISPGDRVGLIGENGCGKSTLLRILAGIEQPDSGTVFCACQGGPGYLPQGTGQEPEITLAAYFRQGIPGLMQAYEQVERLASGLAVDSSSAELQAYGAALSRFEVLGGYQLESDAAAILASLGLPDLPLAARIGRLSSGQRTRVGLAGLLASSPQVLLLDEPTNHLDIDSLEWLESFLAAYRGAFIVVSHDRRFLDRTARRVLELNIRDHRLRAYTGGYSEYEAAKALEVQKQWGSWKDQQAEVRRMEQDIRQTREHALSTERATNNDHLRRLAKKVAQRAKAKEKRLQRYLEGGQHVERPQTPGQIQLSLNADDRSGQVVASLSGVGLRYSETWLYRGVELDLRYGERVALVGPNGSGKTSLLRMLVGEVTPGEGSIAIGPSVRVGYMPQEQELLNPRQSALDVIRELAPMSDSAVYNFLHYFLIYDDKVRQPVGQFSYGERTRLLLARLVVSGANCLLLDEPVNHLDIPSRQQFETALQGFPGSVIISIHDRAFIENFAATIWRIRDAHLVKEVLRA